MPNLAFDTQAALNTLYRGAILKAVTDSNSPLGHTELTQAVLGGSIPVEIMSQIPEPYVPALCQLVISEEVVYYRGENDHLLVDLFSRANDAAKASSQEVRDEMPDDADPELVAKMDKVEFYDDPTAYRIPTSELLEMMNGGADQLGDILRKMSEGTADGEGAPEDSNVIIH